MGAAASASQTSTNKANKATAVVPIDTEAEPVVPIDTEAEPVVPIDTEAEPVVPIDTEAQAVVSIDTEADRTAAENCADIHQAAREGNVGAVRHFLRVDPGRLESKDFRGRTPLWWAAEKCHVEVVELLLRSDASAEVADDKGWTPLIRAAYHGQVEAVELLLMFGALVAARDSAYGDTARDWAALRGHAAVVEKLILAEAEVSVVLLSGRGCHCASSQDRTVLELKEEAEKKLDVCIEHIIRQNHERLDESQTLAAANVSPGDTLTAVIAAAMLSQPGANSTSPAEDPDLVVKEFGHGICITAEQSFFDEYGPKIEVLESWSELNGVSSLEEVLPAGHVPLSRLLRLSPEGRTFPAPVQVEMPTCAGAQALWRSTARGWEKVDTVTFHDTRALMELDHFCEIVVTGKCRPLKALGFLHPEGENAQVVIMHIGCESCEAGLELLCSDTDVLQHFRRCGPSRQLGMFRHDEDLEIKQADQISRMKIRFHRMPLMSRELDAQSRQHFDVEIEGESHCFKVRPEGACATAATAATAATTAAAAPAALAATSAEPVSPNSGLEPDAAASAQASSATAPGDMRSAAEAQQGHLLLSGRFNSDTNIAYMKSVKEQLEARHVPVFMVEATVGQSFADLTRIGLGRAKGMVTFCTSEYGAYTGVGYETFHELEFAHDHQLPLFPIRLCEQWPPAPQNNERGIYQNQLVFKNGLVYIDDRQMTSARGVADQIAESVARMGIF